MIRNRMENNPLQNSGNPPIFMGSNTNHNNQNFKDFSPYIDNNLPYMANMPASNPTIGYGGYAPTNNINMEVQTLMNQKDLENSKLRQELELLKMGTDKINNMKNTGDYTLGDIKLKLGGGVPNGIQDLNTLKLDMYNGGMEALMQNQVRSVDLTEEERILTSLTAQEIDALKLISQIPIGTEIYRFKMEQFKELSTTRSEIEKIVQEQRLQRLRRDFEKKRREEDRQFENDKWVDDQRRNIIATRLKKDLAPTGQNNIERKYDPLEGILIHWDYSLGIPKRNDYCRIVYGVYCNGEEIYAPRLIDAHDTEIDTSVSNRCIFGESHLVADIPANANTLIIFELQIAPNKESLNAGRILSYGWSQLDLFDARRELRYI